MKKIVLCVMLSWLHRISALRTISDTEFARIPLLHDYDKFSQCVDQERGVYCTAHAILVSEGPNQLYDLIRNYSESATRHFNYTKIIRGYCMTSRCNENQKESSELESKNAIESCMNETMERDHGLRARVSSFSCYRHDKRVEDFDIYDTVATVILVSLFTLNIAGTLVTCFGRHKDPKGYLACFSLTANWARLTAPWPDDPMTSRLIGINGIRTLTSILVIVLHSLLPQVLLVENPHYLETAFETTHSQFLFHVHIIMQTFFFLSGLFLTYTLQVSSEKNPLIRKSLPKAVFLRWLRLSPVYFVMLMSTATLAKFASYGPIWKEILGNEVADCRRYWPIMALNLNNYVDYMECGMQHWSTACDMHLHIIGLSIMLLSPNPKIRNIALWVLFVVGFFLPGVETYYRDLDGSFIAMGEAIHAPSYLYQSRTYTHLYKRTHTNIPCFVIGMALGIMLYDLFKKPIDTRKYKKFSYLYWLLLPALLGLIFANSFLSYKEGGRASMPVRLLYALLQKPAWGVSLMLLVLGMIFQVEKVPLYRRVLEWRGWVPLMRLTYCTYNVHVPLLRWLAASSSLSYFSDLHAINMFFGATGLSFSLALILWLLVEAPFANLIRKIFPDKKSVLDRSSAKTE